jgi:hypothetical protein
MRAHDYTPLFKTEHMLKDVRLCLQQARASGVPFPAAAHAGELLEQAVKDGRGEQDYACVVEVAERAAGGESQGGSTPNTPKLADQPAGPGRKGG